MRVLCLRIAVATFWLCGSAGAQDSPSEPSALISRCADSVDGEVTGLEALESECPGLTDALNNAGFSSLLSDRELEQLTTYGLTDLLQLAARYVTSDDSRAAGPLSPEGLQPVLETLRQPEQAQVPLTWFQRLQRWLRDLFDQREEPSQSWLTRWLKDVDVPDTVREVILYASIGLVIVLAIVVVINELRAAGVLRRKGDRARGETSESGETGVADLANRSIETGDQPAAMFRQLIDTLIQTGRLRVEKSLTHRELAQRAAFDASDQRTRFEQVAVLCEKLLYGSGPVPREQIDAVLDIGTTLQRELGQSRPNT